MLRLCQLDLLGSQRLPALLQLRRPLRHPLLHALQLRPAALQLLPESLLSLGQLLGTFLAALCQLLLEALLCCFERDGCRLLFLIQ